MPGPFPGMDPYIENVEISRSAHHWFITTASEQLQPQLNPRGYFVDVENRVWLEEPERAVYPDVILREAPLTGKTERADASGTFLGLMRCASTMAASPNRLSMRKRPPGRAAC